MQQGSITMKVSQELCDDASVCDACVKLAGAHNTIVTARAGKDLVSCLVSGLLTIGPRFGGAVDDAARYFQDACDRGDDHATNGQFLAQTCMPVPCMIDVITTAVTYRIEALTCGL